MNALLLRQRGKFVTLVTGLECLSPVRLSWSRLCSDQLTYANAADRGWTRARTRAANDPSVFTITFTFNTQLRHYAKQMPKLNMVVDMKLGRQRNYL